MKNTPEPCDLDRFEAHGGREWSAYRCAVTGVDRDRLSVKRWVSRVSPRNSESKGIWEKGVPIGRFRLNPVTLVTPVTQWQRSLRAAVLDDPDDGKGACPGRHWIRRAERHARAPHPQPGSPESAAQARRNEKRVFSARRVHRGRTYC